MASVHDRWYVTRKLPDGSVRRERSERYGIGMRWQLRWRDAEGVPRKKAFARRIEADRQKAEIETELARGTYIDPNAGMISFRDYAEKWRKSQFDDPNTTYQVGIRFKLHVYPAFGRTPLRAINPSTIRDWVHGLTMERSYQRTIFKNASQVFTAAIADDLISKNPCRSSTVRMPVADPHEVVPWTPEWVAGVREELPDRYAITVDLGGGVGLRQGEIFGLSPDDVDITRGKVHVRRQIKLTPSNMPYFALPKGRKTRTVPIAPKIAEAVMGHLAIILLGL